MTCSELANHTFLSDEYKKIIDGLTSIHDPFFWKTPKHEGLTVSPGSYCLTKVIFNTFYIYTNTSKCIQTYIVYILLKFLIHFLAAY